MPLASVFSPRLPNRLLTARWQTLADGYVSHCNSAFCERLPLECTSYGTLESEMKSILLVSNVTLARAIFLSIQPMRQPR